MTPSSGGKKPHRRLPSGEARELLAIAAATAVAGAVIIAEGVLLAILAGAVFATVMGIKLPALAYRQMRAAMGAALHAAEVRIGQILRGVSRAIRSDVERAILQDLPGGLGARAAASALGAPAPPAWNNLPVLLHQMGLNALRETDDEFRRITKEAMAYHTAIGARVRHLHGQERRDLSLSRLRVAQKMLDDFAAAGIPAFTDRSGRQWDLASYAEMATRTAAARMHLMLYLQAMGPAGFDLVLVIPLTDLPPCPKCAPYVGKVLSIKGMRIGETVSVTDSMGTIHTQVVFGSLPDAVKAGLLHPSCRHTIIPFTNGAFLTPPPGPRADPNLYEDEQRLRALERALRRAKQVLEVAMTPDARADARRTIARIERDIRNLAQRTGIPRLPYREELHRAR